MSSRALKRLEKQKQEAISKQELVEDEEEEIAPVSKPKFNAFALLNDSESEDEVDNKTTDEAQATVEVPTKVEFTEPSSTGPASNKKKSKSKKKKKNKKAPVQNDDGDEEENHDDIDQILAELNLQNKAVIQGNNGGDNDNDGDSVYDFEAELDEISNSSPITDYDSNFKYFTSSKLRSSLRLLSIKNVKNLDSDQEFKTLFGNLSSETIDDANSTTALAISPEVLQQFKKIARLTRGWGGNDRRGIPGTTRKLLISKIRDDYLPTSQRPMMMEEINETDIYDYFDYKEDAAEPQELELKIKRELDLGIRYFKFSKINTINERVANTRFYASVVITPDHESLMQLLQQYPYHAETLLQVAMVLLRQGEHKSTSNALIEKALFVFDRSFQKRFHELLSAGNSELIRLPYECFLNRQFYLCMFRYISALGERSAYFTALSFCKLLLSLSPAEDPLGVRYFIDHYAILSQEYKYLVSLSMSPLFTTYSQWMTPGIAFSTALAYLYLDDEAGAREQLKSAYKIHPLTAFKLIELIGLSDPLPIKESDIPFTTQDLLTSETYLVRAPLLWSDPHKKLFLQKELFELFQTVPIKRVESKGISSMIYSMFKKNEQEENQDLPFNLIRFAILSGESKLMGKLPEAVWSREDTFEYDALPPKKNSIDYDVHRGIIENQTPIIDSLLDYVDQGLLGTIIQNRTSENDFDDLLRQFQQEHPVDVNED